MTPGPLCGRSRLSTERHSLVKKVFAYKHRRLHFEIDSLNGLDLRQVPNTRCSKEHPALLSTNLNGFAVGYLLLSLNRGICLESARTSS